MAIQFDIDGLASAAYRSIWSDDELESTRSLSVLGVLWDLESRGVCRDIRKDGDAFVCETTWGEEFERQQEMSECNDSGYSTMRSTTPA